MALGVSSGVLAETLYHSHLLAILIGLAGLAAGYLLGILAGLWLQYLGWLAVIISGLAGLAAMGIFFVDLVLLAGRILR